MLTQAELELLEFEDTHPRQTGLKTDQIRMTLNLTVGQYYQRLNGLSRRPDAVAVYPQLCSRLQRLSARRTAQRAGLIGMLREQRPSAYPAETTANTF